MYKLALIGKDISHSKSQKMYEEILDTEVEYDLIDCRDIASLPKLKDLFPKYQGVSITAPYKRAYLDQVSFQDKNLIQLNAINALKLGSDGFYGSNTDYFAMLSILEEYIVNKGINYFVILGDGAMSTILQLILSSLGKSFIVLSRKLGNLTELENIVDELLEDQNTLVINSCGRSYRCDLSINQNYRFWDLNYGIQEHHEHFSSQEVEYIDGLSLLKLQARFALSFWNLKTI